MRAVCSIITKSHLHFAKVLYQSILRFIDIPMHLLVVDMDSNENLEGILPNMHLYDLSIIRKNPIGEQIYHNYYTKSKDKFRWSSKPVFMKELLKSKIDAVIYMDSDLFFFRDPSFLFETLDRKNILLSPHFRCNDPAKDYKDFGRNNTHGLFNGGFIGARKDGIPALDWWAHACERVCEINRGIGYYVDQSHLNLMPILFEEIGIIKNRGCNVASWNRITCQRTLVDGEVIFGGKDQLVFIHFTSDTIKGILKGEDLLLMPYLEEYEKSLRKLVPNFNFKKPLSFWSKWIKL